MSRKSVCKGTLTLAFGLFVLQLFTPSERWQGRVENAEFTFRFVDASGNPVEGVRLDVYYENGARAPYFPVTDYSEGHSLTSGQDGNVIFHHVGPGCPELGGDCHHFLFVFHFGGCDTPRFRCEFSLKGRLSYSIDYFALQDLLYGTPGSSVAAKMIRFRNPDGIPLHFTSEGAPDEREVRVLQLGVIVSVDTDRKE